MTPPIETKKTTLFSAATIAASCASGVVMVVPPLNAAATGERGPVTVSVQRTKEPSFVAMVNRNGEIVSIENRDEFLCDSKPMFPGDLAARFNQLASLWRSEIGPSSSAIKMANHPAYKKIIEIGEDAVPLILKELKDRPAQWFIALTKITGENPILHDDRGDMRRMVDAWLNWGREREHIAD